MTKPQQKALISRTEIRKRARAFARRWKDEAREAAEAKSFWDEFFHVFGKDRKVIAAFEDPVKKLSGKGKNFIDLFWKGQLIVEHKTKGKSLTRAESQAMNYIQALVAEGRADEAPRYLIVSDFATIALHDLELDKLDKPLIIGLEDLHKHVDSFIFIAGYTPIRTDPEDPVNIEAAEKMAALHDALREGGYPAEDLGRFLTRILFCLFAEDTELFSFGAFSSFIQNRTNADGSDLGAMLSQLFRVLNTPTDKRMTKLDDDLKELPYVNGELFAGALEFPSFDAEMRDSLLAAAGVDWSGVSPAVFGSMFQGVMEKKDRRQIGAHYTSERDILRTLKPLFLDDLQTELLAAIAQQGPKLRKQEIDRFLARLSGFRFFDPACGCGNFLIVAYREIRRLELQALKALHDDGNRFIDVSLASRVRIEQFHGIEILQFPCEIARVAMWLIDHLMNLELGQALGSYFHRLPLKGHVNVTQANALEVDWTALVPPGKGTFVFGNPPFAGHRYRSEEQGEELKRLWGKDYNKLLDYVTGWYAIARTYGHDEKTRFAFVSTNSISQGEQVALLWGPLFRAGFHLDFAHQTFNWRSEARGTAHVHVVIVGFSYGERRRQLVLYEYARGASVPLEKRAKSLSPYLVEGPELIVAKQADPISSAMPPVLYGSLPADGGGLVVKKDEYPHSDAAAKKYLRRYIGSKELLNERDRWCLWMPDGPDPVDVRKSPFLASRLAMVAQSRKKSDNPDTQELASQPYRFFHVSVPKGRYVAFPAQVSGARSWYTVDYLDQASIPSNTLYWAKDPDGIAFAIASSTMFMCWLRTVGGGIRDDPRFGSAVYNAFPLPLLSEDVRGSLSKAGKALQKAREQVGAKTLASIYLANSVRREVVLAHEAIDKIVDKIFGLKARKPTEELRISVLLDAYAVLAAELYPASAKPSRKKSKAALT